MYPRDSRYLTILNPLTTGRLDIAINFECQFKLLSKWFGVDLIEFKDEVRHGFGRNGDRDLFSRSDLFFEIKFCCFYDIIDEFADSFSLGDDAVICSTSGPSPIVIEYFELD
ncbi:hypothetical protein SZ63_11205 [Methanoculleus sediminis]|uniref:Uncharacterized protein n=1 Tax=Methanoculleus sediminis TaxID=1550566 RepID=A0A0H1QW28_9EURY|nr:hypothetical protein SZ63_11205 [Methanoculleus sediminis]